MPHHDHDHEHCRALFERLSDYLDGEMDADANAEVERHLAGCIQCSVCLETLKQTVALCRRLSTRPIPDRLSHRLRSLLGQAAPPI